MKRSVWPVIQDYSDRLDPDPPHAQQVCRLSGMLFDDLRPLHHLPPDTRDLLKAAALLHDIGWSRADKPHHKASRDIILNDTTMNLTSRERKIIALIARYHRKSHPRPDHAVFKELCEDDKQIVSWCSGILRVADVLDRAHQNLVREIHCFITSEEIVISCTCKTPLYQDSPVFAEKSMLLQELTHRRICLSCT
jgi:exopolyphosphatase/guanosine-5'-triphosphate,3'-diphosphate pyrophosphatase